MSDSTNNSRNSASLVEARFEHSPNFVDILNQLNATLLVSTYQAGKLFTIGSHQGNIAISFYHFDQAMGVAVGNGMIAVGSKRQIWFLKSAADLSMHVAPAGKYDATYLTRTSHYTGAILGHELAWAGHDLWLVNTLFSSLCTLHADFSFVPRWRPPFISDLAAEDRCHLNGLCIRDGQPRYVTALAESNTPAGWRDDKSRTGVIVDVSTNQVIARGMAMPHSPRWHDGRLWVLDSGNGRLSVVSETTNQCDPVSQVEGYARGLAFCGPYAFVGMSLIRESAIFGGLPIGAKRDQLQCGVAVIDWRTGQQVGGLIFHSGVQEIFDVQILPNVRCPILSGPLPDMDGQQTIWLAPSQSAR